MLNDQRNLSILSYITIIGWLISYLQLDKNRGDLLIFHLRQSVGLHLFMALNVMVVTRFSWMIYGFIALVLFVLWVIGFVGAAHSEQRSIPVIGDDFQRWFRFIQ